MSTLFLTPIDMSQLEILNLRIHQLASDPVSPVEGQLWYNTTDHVLRYRTNSATIDVGSGGPTDEYISDLVGAMFSGNTETGITVTYQDADNTIDLVVSGDHTLITDFDTQVRTSRLDQMAAPTASVGLNSQKITSLADGTAATDAINLGQLQAVQQGIDWKQSVRAASTANGTLATAFENGDTLDGVTLATGDRILLKNQSTGAENGIYTVNASGAPTRATDADASADVTGGLAVWVNEGTVNADTGWVLTTNDAITLGTTALVFAQFSGLGQVTSGAGLTKTGNTLDVGAGTGISVAADAVAIDTAVVVRKYAADVGDGAATSYNIDHNLGTLDAMVQVYRKSDGVQVECDITRSTTNRVILAFSVAPTSAQYRVVVQA